MNIDLCKNIEDLPTDDNLQIWLGTQAKKHNLSYLLAHADDGVIWGRFDNESLITADKVNHPKFQGLPALRLSTLQQCRMFGQQGEVLLWKSNGILKARLLSDVDIEGKEIVSSENRVKEHQLLWGTHGIQQDGFTLLRDGTQGLKHAIPIADDIQLGDKGQLKNKACLVVNHYIEYDSDGLARINLSRLVDLAVMGVVK